MNRFRLLFLTAAIALLGAIWAQSRITADQLRAGAASNLRVLAVDATTGRFAYLTLGAGVEIAGTTLQGAAAAPRIPVQMMRSADGTYGYPGGGVYRNGLLQTPAVDYTIAAGTVKPVQPWAVDDVVTGY